MDEATANSYNLGPGRRVVHVVSGNTGEIRLRHGWGVEVFNTDRDFEREEWGWKAITVRIPRRIKRYPRPFRFPRPAPTLQCHCKIGRMEVKKPNEVQCQRCGFLVGSEAYPGRYERACEMLCKAAVERFKRKRPRSKAPVARRASGKRKVLRSNQRAGKKR